MGEMGYSVKILNFMSLLHSTDHYCVSHRSKKIDAI